MEYSKALKIAERIKSLLEPHCARIEIAGSLRRQKQDVHDIEIVCIPQKIKVKEGLWEWKEYNCDGFVKVVNSFGHIKGDAREGKYMQRRFSTSGNSEGINIDIFTAVKENWGYIMAIRTGPAGYSKRLVTRAKCFGYLMKDGEVYNLHRQKIAIPDEKIFFRICNENYVKPEYRIG